MNVTTYQHERAAILERIKLMWWDDVKGEPITPIAWPNTQIKVPDGQPYIEPVINTQAAFNAAMTATDKLVRHPGMLTINVRVPPNTGTARLDELADMACGMFRNVTFEGITFRAPTVRYLTGPGPHTVAQVDCPYHRDSILAHA
jgi:hypothetical protein